MQRMRRVTTRQTKEIEKESMGRVPCSDEFFIKRLKKKRKKKEKKERKKGLIPFIS